MVLGPDPERHLAAIEEFSRAGFEQVYEREVLPRVGAATAHTAGRG
jgi:hypothetical protein